MRGLSEWVKQFRVSVIHPNEGVLADSLSEKGVRHFVQNSLFRESNVPHAGEQKTSIVIRILVVNIILV